MTAARPRPDIARLIRAGYSNRQIGEQLKCGRDTVARTRKAMGLPPAPQVPVQCRNGHDRAEHTRTRANGKRYCATCAYNNDRAAWDRKFDAKHPGHPTSLRPGGHRTCLVCTRQFEVDEIAVLRATAGDPPARLNPAERQAAVLQLRRQQLSGSEIARRIGCTDRTVWRVLRRNRPEIYRQAA